MFLCFASVIVASTEQAEGLTIPVNTAEEKAVSQKVHPKPIDKPKEAWLKYFRESEDPTAVAADHVVYSNSYQRRDTPPIYNAPVIADAHRITHYLTEEEFKEFFPTEEIYEKYYPEQSKQNPYNTLRFS